MLFLQLNKQDDCEKHYWKTEEERGLREIGMLLERKGKIKKECEKKERRLKKHKLSMQLSL